MRRPPSREHVGDRLRRHLGHRRARVRGVDEPRCGISTARGSATSAGVDARLVLEDVEPDAEQVPARQRRRQRRLVDDRRRARC